jgi:hypothetical protein
MPGFVKTFLKVAVCAVSAAVIGTASYAAQTAPTGAWRTTNDCFMAAFLLNDTGQAEAVYLSGERDPNLVWTWDGTTLRITSMAFPLDKFTGHLANERMEVDYVWHDLDRDQLHSQACVFERFSDGSI